MNFQKSSHNREAIKTERDSRSHSKFKKTFRPHSFQNGGKTNDGKHPKYIQK